MALIPRELVVELLTLLKDDCLWERPELVSATIDRVRQVLQGIDEALAELGTGGTTISFTTAVDGAPHLEALRVWLDSCSVSTLGGGCYRYAASQDSTKGNAVVALKDIEAGEEVMRVPRKAMLSAKFGLGPHPSICASLLPHFEDNSVLQLAVVVAYHKMQNESSFFRPFLDVLPNEFTIPLYWSSEVFSCFQHTATACRAAKSFRAAVMLYFRALSTIERVNIEAFPSASFTWSLFRWSLSAVLTRQNHIPSLESIATAEEHPGTVAALVPGWDMMNHAPGKMTSQYDERENCLVFAAMASCKAGDEICMCYGYRMNELYLLYSGFCMQDNPYDAVDLVIPVEQDDLKKIRDCLVRSVIGPDSPVELQNDGMVIVPLRRDENALPSVATFCALASVVDRAEAAAIIRSRITNYNELAASGLISEETKLKTSKLLNSALLACIEKLQLASSSFDAAHAAASPTNINHSAVLNACMNFLQGQADILRSKLDQGTAVDSSGF